MRPPTDQGLPALGLICAALMHVTLALGTVFVVSQISQLSSGTDRLLAIATLVAGFVRAAFHSRAADRLRERSPELIAAVKTYAWVAIGTTAIFGVATAALIGEMPVGVALAIGLLGLYWPLTLWLLVSRKAVRAAFATSDTFDLELVPGDRSIEGLGILMVTFAALGLATLLSQLPFVLSELDGAPPLLAVSAGLSLVVLLARGLLHLTIGVRALRDLPPERLDKATTGYLILAYVSAGLLVLTLFSVSRGNLSPALLGASLIGGYFLVAWPHVVRRFSTRLVFDTDGQPIAPTPHGPASDRGLTALGYLLIAVTGLLLVLQLSGLLLVALHVGPGFGIFLFDTHTIVGLAAHLAGLWAGLELLTLSPRRVLACAAYTLISVAALAVDLGMHDDDLSSSQRAFTLAAAAVMPILALVFSLRRAAPVFEATPPRGTPARTD